MSAKEKPPDDSLALITPKADDFYKCIKVSLKHILKHPDINLSKINDTVITANKIVIHTLQFMKLYLLDFYNKNNTLPNIDKVFINSCMKILCNETATGRPPKKEIVELKNKLKLFQKEHYKIEELSYSYMNTILDYLTIDVLTMYENNIKLHYVEYIEKYVNFCWKKKFIIEKIRKLNITQKEKESRVNKLCNELRKIKNDILNVEEKKLKSHSSYHNWIHSQLQYILPNKVKFQKNNIRYDLQCNPQDYLPCMVYMMKRIENEGNSILNVFPLRSEICPKHIRIDTTTLVHLLLRKEQGNKSEYLFKGNLKRFEDKIWKFFFRTERKCFTKKHYTFHHMIETDGIGCSILLLRNDLIGKRVNVKKGLSNEKYIDELDNYEELQNKKIVAIDPGLNSLIYCVDSDNKNANVFQYTQDSRRKETKSKKYSKIILEQKKTKINGKNIIEYETQLSKYNRKTLDFYKFKEYIKKKNEINNILMEFYNKHLFRKLKLNGYWNRQKNEYKMINNFKKIFGSPENTIVTIGDFLQKQHMKYKEATKGKGIRTLFRKNGYKVFLVDEFRTSCKCSKCEGGECKKFIIRENPRPYRNNLRLVHSALSCKNCDVKWNRDCNGSTNIYKIAYNSINKKERPSYLCRSKNSVVLDDTTKT
jgi:transposase